MLKQVFEIIIIIIDLEVAHPRRQTNSDSPGQAGFDYNSNLILK
jgi:hypothetical protein